MTHRILPLALALALLPTPVSAREPAPNELARYEIAFQALNAADAIQTCDFLARGKAHELNPILGKHPSCPEVIGFKIAAGALHYVLVREIAKTDPKLARVVQIVTIAIQGSVVAANLRFTF